MEIFSLTETEFFQMLTEGKNDNPHIAYKDFVLQVSSILQNYNCVWSQIGKFRMSYNSEKSIALNPRCTTNTTL